MVPSIERLASAAERSLAAPHPLHSSHVTLSSSLPASEERIDQGSWEIDDCEPVPDFSYPMEADIYGPLTARVGLRFSF
jgi:hypothetical protein